MRNFLLLSAICFIFISCQDAGGKSESAINHRISASFTASEIEKPDKQTLTKGNQVFISTCSKCHNDSAKAQGPSLGILANMTPRSVYEALVNGKMKVNAEKLSDEEKKAVAQFVTQKILQENTIPEDVYTAFAIEPDYNASFDISGWGGNAEGTGFRTAAQAGIDLSNVFSLKLKWAFAFPDATQVRCKPALVGKWLIAGSQFGEVYSINTETGRPGWKFKADAAIRGGIAVKNNGNDITAYFADNITNVYALNIKSGELIWKKRAGFHPQSTNTGTVAVNDNKLFVPISSLEVITAKNPDYDCCNSSGGVVAMDAMTGNILWTYKVISEEAKKSGKKKNGKFFYGPAGAPVWCSPTVDAKRGLLYIGTGENYTYPATNTSDAIQALDMNTGKLVWSFQGTHSDTWNLACPGDPNCPDKEGPDLDFGMAPLLVHKTDGKDILLAGQKSGVVHALTPEGKLLWQKRIGKGGALGGIHWGMASDGKFLYAANSDNVIALDQSDSTVKASPGIYALDINTGNVIWKTPVPPCDTSVKGCLASNSAAPTVIPGIVFAGALDGHLRAYDSNNGKIIWDYNTMQPVETSNKIKGKGGAIDGSAPVVANGMLFVNSGYGWFGEPPGNLLLAFEVEKKK